MCSEVPESRPEVLAGGKRGRRKKGKAQGIINKALGILTCRVMFTAVILLHS